MILRLDSSRAWNEGSSPNQLWDLPDVLLIRELALNVLGCSIQEEMRFEDWWECGKTHPEKGQGVEEGSQISHGTLDSVRTQHSALNFFGNCDKLKYIHLIFCPVLFIYLRLWEKPDMFTFPSSRQGSFQPENIT